MEFGEGFCRGVEVYKAMTKYWQVIGRVSLMKA